MDPQVVKILHDAFQKATNDANVLQTLKRLDQSIVYMSGAEYADYARRQFDREKVIVEKFGLRGQS